MEAVPLTVTRLSLNSVVHAALLRPVLQGDSKECELLMLRREEGLWSHVGGAVEPGETAWQAVLREIHEETGLQPNRFYSADMCIQYYKAQTDVVEVSPCFVGFVAADSDVKLNSEHSTYRWCSLQMALNLSQFPSQHEFYEYVWKHFVDKEPTLSQLGRNP